MKRNWGRRWGSGLLALLVCAALSPAAHAGDLQEERALLEDPLMKALESVYEEAEESGTVGLKLPEIEGYYKDSSRYGTFYYAQQYEAHLNVNGWRVSAQALEAYYAVLNGRTEAQMEKLGTKYQAYLTAVDPSYFTSVQMERVYLQSHPVLKLVLGNSLPADDFQQMCSYTIALPDQGVLVMVDWYTEQDQSAPDAALQLAEYVVRNQDTLLRSTSAATQGGVSWKPRYAWEEELGDWGLYDYLDYLTDEELAEIEAELWEDYYGRESRTPEWKPQADRYEEILRSSGSQALRAYQELERDPVYKWMADLDDAAALDMAPLQLKNLQNLNKERVQYGRGEGYRAGATDYLVYEGLSPGGTEYMMIQVEGYRVPVETLREYKAFAGNLTEAQRSAFAQAYANYMGYESWSTEVRVVKGCPVLVADMRWGEYAKTVFYTVPLVEQGLIVYIDVEFYYRDRNEEPETETFFSVDEAAWELIEYILQNRDTLLRQ